MTEIEKNVIIDNSISSIKCGLSGDETPKSVFPNIYSPNSDKIGDYTQNDNVHPIVHGIIKDFDKMEKIWEYVFDNELHVKPEEKMVLMSDAPMAPKINREKICQIMFEKFNIQGLFICIRPLLSLYCTGKTNAIILESGEDLTQCVPIIEGYFYPFTISKCNYGGNILTDYFSKYLKENNINPSHNILEEMKKKAKLSLDYDKESKESNNTKVNLPDGKEICLKNEILDSCEALFNPLKFNKEFTGIQYQVYNSLYNCDNNLRNELISNIVLSGGNTLINNFAERMENEISCLINKSLSDSVKVSAPNERRDSAWIGGSLIANLQNFQGNWVMNNDYQEAGPQIINRKCF